ncbi:MAG: carboxypeptidase-like regulatory domain-containing protein [Sandaracinaceae bacterium]
MNPRRLLLALALSGLTPTLLACGSSEEPLGQTSTDEGSGETSSGVATIEGTVRLAAGAEVGRYPENPMVGGRGQPELAEACTPPREDDREPVRRNPDGSLTGVLVAMADFQRDIPHEAETHTLSIIDCRLTPRLIVATRGDTLLMRNETDYPYLPDFGTGMMRALLHNEERTTELGQGGVRSLSCGFAAPCGRAEIVTLYHPLHAITDESGHYRIEGVPAGEALRINAWHPLFVESNETLTLRSGETRTVDMVLRPADIPEPASPSTFEGHPEDDPNNPLY